MMSLNFMKGTGVLRHRREVDHSHQCHVSVMKQVDLPYTQNRIPSKLQASKEEAHQIRNGHIKMVINTHPFQFSPYIS